MKSIKFSNDYDKLPLSWEGTQAVLIGVVFVDMEQLKYRIPQLVEFDTKIRDMNGHYQFNFKNGILLTFFHLNSKIFFTTIRRHTINKFDYYCDCIWQTFILEKVKNNEKH